MVKIAIAGAGDMARYFSEELLKKSFQVVILTRSEKSWLAGKTDIETRLTDYDSVESIRANIEDCDGLVSVLLDYGMGFAKSHLNIIEAILKTSHCKRFIPSEYGGDLTNYPDQPVFYAPNHNPVREKLRSLSKSQLEWTLLNVGWLNDYFVSTDHRYIKDIGDAFPVNWEKKTLNIPGTGNEPIAFTAARDVGKAVTALFESEKAWDEIIYVCGETTTWNKIGDKFPELKRSYRSLGTIVNDIVQGALEKDEYKKIAAEYELMSCSGALLLPEDIRLRQKETYFKNVHFRTNDEIIAGGKVSGFIV